MARNLQIDGARLWESLMTMARIGATQKGGVCRLALSDLDRESRDLFRRWCEAAGCTVSVDPMGNMFARRPGRREDLPPVGTGSHLDSQPTGGRFDGVYGVLAGLEVVRTLNDHRIETDAPVEVAMWTNEEGARFPPAMLGSAVFAGVFDLDYGWSREDHDGHRVGEELDRIGYRGDGPLGHPYGAFFEAHIEQGPILEAEKKRVGVVTGVQGVYWYDLTITGDESHAGPTPMEMRRDAMAGAARLMPRIYRLALDRAPHGRATIGEFRLHPGSRNTVPGRVELSIDLRHPAAEEIDAMDAELHRAAEELVRESDLEVELSAVWKCPPTAFDPECIDAVHKGVALMDYPAMEIVSGAGHDSVHVSKVAPTAMIFVPCENGISHNEIENATPEDLEAGANVLLHAILERAERAS